jgi:hypothetical protein
MNPLLEVLRPTTVPGLHNVKQISLGAFATRGGHMLALLNNGTVMAVGTGDLGQLGTGTLSETTTVHPVPGLTGIVKVAASLYSSLALTSTAKVYSWGSNNYGEVGVPTSRRCGTSTCAASPVLLGLGGVSNIGAGFGYSAALTGGKLYAWGRNDRAQLGNGTEQNVAAPAPVPGVTEVSQLTTGTFHANVLSTAPAPAPQLIVAPALLGVSLSWPSGVAHQVRWKEARPGVPFIGLVNIAGALGYTIPRLIPGVVWEVFVKSEGHNRVAQVAPLVIASRPQAGSSPKRTASAGAGHPVERHPAHRGGGVNHGGDSARSVGRRQTAQALASPGRARAAPPLPAARTRG